MVGRAAAASGTAWYAGAMKIESVETRYGAMLIYADDEYIGHSLRRYGEYSEAEVALWRKLVKAGDTVFDIGANIGASTLPLADIVGQQGLVLAFEPQPENYDLLLANVCTRRWIVTKRAAVGDQRGEIAVPPLAGLGHHNYGRVELGSGTIMVPLCTIDTQWIGDGDLFIKIDVEGMEAAVLRGANQTVAQYRPLIYCENDRPEKQAELEKLVRGFGYRLWEHLPPLYSSNNFNAADISGERPIVSINLLAIPDEKVQRYKDVLHELREKELVHRHFVITNPRDPFSAEIARAKKQDASLGNQCYIAGLLQLDSKWQRSVKPLQRVLAVDPDYHHARYLLALSYLALGRYDEAWPLYEARKWVYNAQTLWYYAPQWDGTPTDAKLLIWQEGGFGDVWMFARFLPEALKRAPNTTLAVLDTAVELMRANGYERITGMQDDGSGMWRTALEPGQYDLQCSIQSLPHVLGNLTFPGIARGFYLGVPTDKTEHWRLKLLGRPRVGFSWQGNPRNERDALRSIPIQMLQDVFTSHNVLGLTPEMIGSKEWIETAAIISNLDLVISIDTSIAHLAGALGKRTLVLSSYGDDWRWSRAVGEKLTPWYRSVTIERCPTHGDWATPLRKTERLLEKMAA